MWLTNALISETCQQCGGNVYVCKLSTTKLQKISKKYKLIMYSNFITVGRGKLFLMRWRRQGFDKTQIPRQLMTLLTPCTVLTVLLLKVLQFSSLIIKMQNKLRPHQVFHLFPWKNPTRTETKENNWTINTNE